jgi:hypothetical protein
MEDDVVYAFFEELAVKQYGIEDPDKDAYRKIRSSFEEEGGTEEALLSGDMDTVGVLKDSILNHYQDEFDKEAARLSLMDIFASSPRGKNASSSSLQSFLRQIVSSQMKD